MNEKLQFAIDTALKNNNVGFLKFVLKAKELDEKNLNCILGMGANLNHLPLVKLALDKGANNINAAFRISCQENSTLIIEFLLKEYPNVDLENGLLGAVLGEKSSVIKLLIKQGAIVSQRALEIAIETKNVSCINALLSAKNDDIDVCELISDCLKAEAPNLAVYFLEENMIDKESLLEKVLEWDEKNIEEFIKIVPSLDK